MPVPVISIAQMRAWEQATWDTGQSVEAVMRLAGKAVAEAARTMIRRDAPVLVLAGKGNNGGDAELAAEQLSERSTTVVDCTESGASLALLRSELERVVGLDGLVVDGLFGIGLNRAPTGHWAEIIAAVNDSGARVLAVDVPSGLLGDNGTAPGAVIRAERTLTFGAPKHGLLAAAAVESVGHLVVAPEIGLTPCPVAGDLEWILAGDFEGYPPRRPVAAHKGAFGHLAILAGSTGYHGAAVLAARGAQRAMPGLISLYPTEHAYGPVAAQLRQTMVHPWAESSALPANVSAVLAGPGLAGADVPEAMRRRVVEAWATLAQPMVVDASALDWLEPGGSGTGFRVVTPHPGEAARMLGCSVADVQADRVAAARAIAAKFGGCHVVLKGSRTVIVSGERVGINGTGNPLLGQGGSGDVLAGYLAGLLAQPLLRSDLQRLVRFAVHQHGLVADRLTGACRAWDLDDFIPRLGNETPTLPG